MSSHRKMGNSEKGKWKDGSKKEVEIKEEAVPR
jgi:hypothetical protein